MVSELSPKLNQNHHQFEVFYDGQCPLCKREIDMIRRKDRHSRLRLTDIAAKDFVPQDKSIDELMRRIHGRYVDGTYVAGVEVFREIYQRLGLSGWVRFTRWPIVSQLMDFGYRVFAYFRFRHAVHRSRKQGSVIQGVQRKDAP